MELEERGNSGMDREAKNFMKYRGIIGDGNDEEDNENTDSISD